MPGQDDLATPPPVGDETKAEKYITKLAQLVEQNKATVFHTDLNKFDPSSLQNHYRIDLKEYQIEVSHSKQADSGQDSYVLLFTNLKNVRENCTEKIILAYTNLTASQFQQFKQTADKQLEAKRRQEEEKRFNAAMGDVDKALDEVDNQTTPTEAKLETASPQINPEEDIFSPQTSTAK